MERFVDWIIGFVALAGLIATAWWGIYAGPNNAQALENMLEEQSNAQLAEAGISWAEIVMDGQHARLVGGSPSFEAQEAALESLGPPSAVFGGITSITSEAVSAPPVSPYVWSAALSETGMLELSGHVPSADDRERLLLRAEEIAPGKVTSELSISAGAPRGDWIETALLGLSALEGLDHGTAALNNLNMTLAGQASNGDIVSDVQTKIASLTAPFAGKSTVTTGADWTAKLDEGTLVLEGTLPSDADRLAILAVAEENFGGLIRDNMIVNDDAQSPWRDAVIAALPEFAKFQTGELSAKSVPQSLRVRGLATGSVEAFLREDLTGNAVPVDIEIERVAVETTELGGLDLSNPTVLSCQQGFDSIMSANTVLFQSGSANIDRTSGQTLDKVMQVARQCGAFRLEVHGHTDSAGNRENNIRLSQSRANAVKSYMVSRGIGTELIDIYGFGPDEPIADNNTATGRAINRRIEFKIAGEG